MHRISLKMALTATLLLGCGVSHPASATDTNGSTNLGPPYHYTVTTGMICPSVDTLKAALDAIEANGDPQGCQTLTGDTSVDATATPLAIYHNGDILGVLTQYEAPGLPTVFGIVQLAPKPVSDAI